MTSIKIFQNLQQLLQHVPTQSQVGFIKDYLSHIDSESIKKEVETYVECFLAGINLKPKTEKLVILVHGIRTQANWFKLLGAEILKNEGFKIAECKYGFVDGIRFWSPVFTRKSAIGRVLANINSIIDDNKDCELYLIAHSYGTYLLTSILKENPHIKFKKIIFCGSILPEDYSWDQLKNFPSETLINECGTKDIWPVLAKTSTFGFGASGRFGFNLNKAKNRYHNLGHSEFFSEDFYKKYWIPFLITGKYESSEWDTKRDQENYLVQILCLFPGLCLLSILSIAAFLLFKFF